MKGKIAIIGDGEGALVFSAAGAEAFAAADAEEAKALLKKIAAEYQVIFVTDVFAVQMQEEIAAYAESAYPIVLDVPSARGGNGYGAENLRKLSERALGMDITRTEREV